MDSAGSSLSSQVCSGAKGKGKGKGKSRKPRQRPEDLGFTQHYIVQDEDGDGAPVPGLWLRTGKGAAPVDATDARRIEIGNLEKERDRNSEVSIQQDIKMGTIDVLCNRMTVLGNPFNMKLDEALREAVCNAFQAYLHIVLDGNENETLEHIAMSVAPKFNLTYPVHFSKDWLKAFGTKSRFFFCNVFRSLEEHAVEQIHSARSLRLLCHCAPSRCHTESIVTTLLLRKSLSNLPSEPCLRKALRPSEPASTATVQDRIDSGRKPSRELLVQAPPAWSNDRGAAGIIAISEPELTASIRNVSNGGSRRVCLVEKRDGRLGFPKGGGETEDATALACALREWREESNLPDSKLQIVDDKRPIIDSRCHYFLARWVGKATAPDSSDGESQSCASSNAVTWNVKDDPADKNPIVLAHWLPLEDAVIHPRLSERRQGLLQQALSQLSEFQLGGQLAVDEEAATAKAPVRRRWQLKPKR
eukprot:TRINITY_DN3409_c0_g1_i1.p1 TRINITY_DN3409_c0_g1~~TRINITY_DN3409_c0_g1_i1.p1  ORF type:complete len:474 (-),score=72.21 TRINITY_DN3409_c0_g1_i1:234-1655(-)